MRSKASSARRPQGAQSVEGELARLRDLDLLGFRIYWQNAFGRVAPAHLTRYLLFKILAYKIQADRLGDLDAKTLKVLESAGNDKDHLAAVSAGLTKLDQRRFVPPPGTVLVREWDRKSHRVMVMPDGFAWNGKTFDSLSQIAFEITGTKWNGPRFFGLRDRRPQTDARSVE